MTSPKEIFVGIDVAKLRNAVVIADTGRNGEIRYMGEFDASPESMTRLIRKLVAKHDKLHFCYEAGPTGYGVYRQIVALGHDCIVVAPSLISRRPGDRVKTNRRDTQSLGRLLRAGELTAVRNLCAPVGWRLRIIGASVSTSPHSCSCAGTAAQTSNADRTRA